MNEAFLFLKKGGLVMIPIALCSVIALTLFLERLWTLQRHRVLPPDFLAMLKRSLRERRWERARSLCDSNNSSVSRVARSGLRYLGHDRSLVREGLEEAGRRETAYMERFVGAIGAVASVAPLIGLLGTVTGMIKVFGRVGEEYEKGGELNPGMLANGIWEALITTAAGLTVAIPAYLMFRYLMSRIDRYVVELEAEATEVVDLVDLYDETESTDHPAEDTSKPPKKKARKTKKKKSEKKTQPERVSDDDDDDDDDEDDE